MAIPEPALRLDSYFAAARIAHETIYQLRRKIAAVSAASRTHELLQESARIVFRDLPQVSAEARALRITWSEASVLDPSRAESIQNRLEAELERIEPKLERLLARQREIAAELQALLRDADD